MPKQRSAQLIWMLGAIFAPALLAIIELFHPAGFTHDPGMFAYLTDPHSHTAAHHALAYFGPDWWFWLHMIQTPTVVLVAIALALTVNADNDSRPLAAEITALVARVALFVFAVYYSVLDAIGGIGLGRTLVLAEAMTHETSYNYQGNPVACLDEIGAPVVCLTPAQLEGVARVLDAAWTDYWIGGVGSVISLTGSYAILFATVAVAVTRYLSCGVTGLGIAGLAGLVSLIGGGYLIQESHACCTGPAGFGLIFIFGCLTWLKHHRSPVSKAEAWDDGTTS